MDSYLNHDISPIERIRMAMTAYFFFIYGNFILKF